MRQRWAGLSIGLLVLACESRAPQAIDDPNGTTTGSSGSGGTSNAGGSGGASTVASTGSGGSSAASGGSAGETSSGGSSGDVTGSGGSAGAGDVDTTPEPCNASDGSGCDENEVCLDTLTDSCRAGFDEDCPGHCASKLPSPSCDEGVAQCFGSVLCPSLPPNCDEGLVSSIVDDCWGPCVPADCCSCGNEVTCPNDDVACDFSEGRCVVPAAPEPRCSLPFVPVSCEGPIQFAFIDGRCQEGTDGACGGNDNRFETIEECLRRCEGLPQQGECPEGRVASSICLACGLGGGCRQQGTVCAKSCNTDEDCDGGMSCVDSVCGANFCI